MKISIRIDNSDAGTTAANKLYKDIDKAILETSSTSFKIVIYNADLDTAKKMFQWFLDNQSICYTINVEK